MPPKSKTKKKIQGLVLKYPDIDRPKIDYADFVQLSHGTEGILFTFGQGHPRRKEVNIIKEIILPARVCRQLAKILDEQIKKQQELVEKIK